MAPPTQPNRTDSPSPPSYSEAMDDVNAPQRRRGRVQGYPAPEVFAAALAFRTGRGNDQDHDDAASHPSLSNSTIIYTPVSTPPPNLETEDEDEDEAERRHERASSPDDEEKEGKDAKALPQQRAGSPSHSSRRSLLPGSYPTESDATYDRTPRALAEQERTERDPVIDWIAQSQARARVRAARGMRIRPANPFIWTGGAGPGAGSARDAPPHAESSDDTKAAYSRPNEGRSSNDRARAFHDRQSDLVPDLGRRDSTWPFAPNPVFGAGGTYAPPPYTPYNHAPQDRSDLHGFTTVPYFNPDHRPASIASSFSSLSSLSSSSSSSSPSDSESDSDSDVVGGDEKKPRDHAAAQQKRSEKRAARLERKRERRVSRLVRKEEKKARRQARRDRRAAKRMAKVEKKMEKMKMKDFKAAAKDRKRAAAAAAYRRPSGASTGAGPGAGSRGSPGVSARDSVAPPHAHYTSQMPYDMPSFARPARLPDFGAIPRVHVPDIPSIPPPRHVPRMGPPPPPAPLRPPIVSSDYLSAPGPRFPSGQNHLYGRPYPYRPFGMSAPHAEIHGEWVGRERGGGPGRRARSHRFPPWAGRHMYSRQDDEEEDEENEEEVDEEKEMKKKKKQEKKKKKDEKNEKKKYDE